MARLHIIYDPLEPGLITRLPPTVKAAVLPIPDDLAGRDIYEIARKLAELLLEQIA